MLGVELIVAQAKQQLLDALQRLACFIGESFERVSTPDLRDRLTMAL